MKRLTLIALMALAASCQKEIPADIPEPGTAGNKPGLLQKVEVVSMPQNQVYFDQLFAYDEAGKTYRITARFAYMSGTGPVVRTGIATFIRNAQGRATSILYVPDTLAARAVLSYQGSGNQLNYVNLVKNQSGGNKVIDSMVFTYNSQSQISRTDQYVLLSGSQLKKTGYQEYTWDAKGNLLSKQTYHDHDDNGIFEPSIKYSWTYDNSPNPRQYDDPAIFYWSTLWPTGGSANNVIKQMNQYPVSGGPDDELNYVFQYNANNKPVTETQLPGGNMTRYTYYQ